jgi:hypothetical protein
MGGLWRPRGQSLVELCGALVLAGGAFWVSRSGGSAPSPTPVARSAFNPNVGAAVPNVYTSGQIWDPSDGCLEDYAADNGTITNDADTELCRAPDTSITDGDFYSYFSKGNGPADWQEIIGTKPDGYTYWELRDGLFHRQPTDGNGQEQVLIKFTDGSSEYVDLERAVIEYPTAISAENFQTEDADVDAVLIERTEPVGEDPQAGQVVSAEEMAARAAIQAEDELTAQLERNYNIVVAQNQQSEQTSQPTNSAFSSNELTILTGEQAKEDRVNTEPDCTDDDKVMDGC